MGPCLCGDPYCPRCGNPGLADLEAAEEWAMEALNKAKLSPEEYRIVVSIGLAAVAHSRRAAKAMIADYQANQAESQALKEYYQQWKEFDNKEPGL